MKYFSVLLYKDVPNPDKIPENWPFEINEIMEFEEVVLPRIKMTEIELNSHLLLYEKDKDEWNKKYSGKYFQSIPLEVPLWAFRSILTLMNLATEVDNLISFLPEPQKTIVYTQWQYGNYIERGHPLINTLGEQLGLTKEDIDNIFIEASKLE